MRLFGASSVPLEDKRLSLIWRDHLDREILENFHEIRFNLKRTKPLKDGRQKIHTSSYKINKNRRRDVAVVNAAG